jgi:tRNA uridine 5-carboxymethylaminomethyl modification enzyme
LTAVGRRVGLVSDARWQRLQSHEAAIERAVRTIQSQRFQGSTLEELLRRPEIGWDDLCRFSAAAAALDLPQVAMQQVCVEVKYAGYIRRQAAEIERQSHVDGIRIPEAFDFLAVPQLRAEAREKLSRIQPRNLGQAGRISGITPADLSILLLYLRGGSHLAS